MSTPAESEARAAAEQAYGDMFSQPLTAAAIHYARVQAFERGYLAALASRVSTPPREGEREELAMTVKQVSQKFGGPSMAEFADTPPIRKHYATADAILAKGFRRPAAIASDAFRNFVDHLGVDSNEEHDGNEWWSGYRQAQRDNIRRANDALNASAAALPEGVRPLAYAVDDLEDGADFQDAISSESIRLVVRYMRARLPGPAVPVPPTEPETLAPMSPVFEDSLTDDEWVERRLAAPTEPEEKQ